MYFTLNKKKLDKERSELNHKAIEVYGDEESEDLLLIEKSNDIFHEIYLDEDEDSLYVFLENKYGNFSINIPLNDTVMIEIVNRLKEKTENLNNLFES